MVLMLPAFVGGVVAAIHALSASTVEATGVTVHAMSFNIRTSYASTDSASTCSNWDGVRKDNVVTQITSVAPDFVGTQETSDAQRTYLDSALAGTYASIGSSSGSLNGNADEINALYYKTSDWTMLENGMFWLGTDPDTMTAGWGMSYYRTCVHGRFQHHTSGDTVCVFNTHYETPGNDEAQENGSKIILAKLDAICQSTDKLVILLGDLNAEPSYTAVQTLFTNDLSEPPADPTFCGDMISGTCQVKYDYTLHRLRDDACYISSQVLRTSYDGCYPSDHAALLGTFCTGGSCCGSNSSSGSSTASLSSSASSSSDGSSTTSTTSSGIFGSNYDSSSAGSVAAGVSGEGLTGGDDDNKVAADAKGNGDDSTATDASGSASEAQSVSTSQESSGSSAGTTVIAVLGIMGAVAGVVFVVIRKKRELDAKTADSKVSGGLAPSYFSRDGSDVVDVAALSPRISGQSIRSDVSESPVPTLDASARKERDSRSSSVSVSDSVKDQYPRKTSGASSRLSSPAMMDRDSSRYNSSVLMDRESSRYHSSIHESRIHFSQSHFEPDSFDSDTALSSKAETDFAML